MTESASKLLKGLVAAPHSPFSKSGEVNLAVIERQVEHLLANDISHAFVCGTTGESSSLSLVEREQIAQRWLEIAKGTKLQVIVHVGSNCLADARQLAAHAQAYGATAIAALAPSYFKPRSIATLVDCLADIAAAAPATPFYYYDIPVLTGISHPTVEFLTLAAKRIPTLAGVKFTNPDLMGFQLCLNADDKRWDIAWGCDEYMLAALALGAMGAVGSSYNFAAPIYHRLWKAFDLGDLGAARLEQMRSVRLIQLLAKFGYMAASKALMEMLDVSVGAPRLPQERLRSEQRPELRNELETLGFFDWITM